MQTSRLGVRASGVRSAAASRLAPLTRPCGIAPLRPTGPGLHRRVVAQAIKSKTVQQKASKTASSKRAGTTGTKRPRAPPPVKEEQVVRIGSLEISTPLFFTVELGALAFTAVLVWAGFSGDLLRQGIIDERTDEILQVVSIIAIFLHLSLGAYMALIAPKYDVSRAQAFGKGILFGSAGLVSMTQSGKATQGGSVESSTPIMPANLRSSKRK